MTAHLHIHTFSPPLFLFVAVFKRQLIIFQLGIITLIMMQSVRDYHHQMAPNAKGVVLWQLPPLLLVVFNLTHLINVA